MVQKLMNLREHVCAQCGKTFECYKTSVFKKHRKGTSKATDYYCSYGCMRKAEKDEADRKFQVNRAVSAEGN